MPTELRRGGCGFSDAITGPWNGETLDLTFATYLLGAESSRQTAT